MTAMRKLLRGSGVFVFTLAVGQCSPSSGNPDPGSTNMPPVVALPPILSDVTPSQSVTTGGEVLTLSGENFQPGAVVTVGSAVCKSLTLSATTITCVIPTRVGTYGPTAVVITNPDLQSVTDASAFSYFPLEGAAVTFLPAVTLSGAFPYRAVIAGDFNKDGNSDIVASGVGGLSVLLGKGDGSVSSVLNYPSEYGRLITTDWNRDGKLDVLASGGQQISLFLGRGDGTLETPLIHKGNGTEYLAAGDLDGDGSVDLVSNNYSLGAYVLPAQDFGRAIYFYPYAVPLKDGARHVALADLNEDHKLDLVTESRYGQTLNVFWGDGTEQFVSTTELTNPWRSCGLAVADLNNDNHLDLVQASMFGGAVNVLFGNGKGGFSTPTALVTAGPSRGNLKVADMNNDGLVDILLISGEPQSLSYLQNQGGGKFAPAVIVSLAQQPDDLTVTDFNGDGLPDVVLANQQKELTLVLQKK